MPSLLSGLSVKAKPPTKEATLEIIAEYASPNSKVMGFKLKVSWNSRVVKKFLRKYDVENFTELSLGKKVESEDGNTEV